MKAVASRWTAVELEAEVAFCSDIGDGSSPTTRQISEYSAPLRKRIGRDGWPSPESFALTLSLKVAAK